MDFSISHSRDIIGNKISVLIKSDRTNLISSVRLNYDSVDISSECLTNPSTHYEKQMNQVGGAGPAYYHSLIIEVTDQNGYIESATSSWQDDH